MTVEPPARPRDVELVHWGRLALRHRGVVLLFVLLSLMTTGYVIAREHPRYEASATVVLDPALADDAAGPGDAPSAEDELALAEGDLLETRAQQRVREPVELRVRSSPNSRLLVFEAAARTAQGAASGAQAYVSAYVELKQKSLEGQYDTAVTSLQDALRSVDAQIAGATDDSEKAPLVAQRRAYATTLQDLLVRKELASSGRPQVISAARVPDAPVPPPFVAFTAIALLAGLVLGLLAAAVVDHSDDRVLDAESVHVALGEHAPAPEVSVVPRLEPWKRLPSWLSRSRSRPPKVVVHPAGSAAGDWWSRTRVVLDQSAPEGGGCPILQVTSCTSDDGAARTAVNLGASFARTDRDVVVVSLDARDPVRLLDLIDPDGIPLMVRRETPLGAFDAIVGEVAVADVLQPVFGQPGLSVVLPGLSGAPVDALSMPAAVEFFATLRACADVVLVLTPPVLLHPEATLVARHTDQTVLVGEVGSSRRREVRRALELLRQAGEEVVAVVLTGGRRPAGRWAAPAPPRSRPALQPQRLARPELRRSLSPR